MSSVKDRNRPEALIIEQNAVIFPSDIPGSFCPSVYIDGATSGFDFQAFFPVF
jgi:hypothetical protein